MDYFKKLDTNPYQDLYWNLPETKQGTISVIGGNLQNFQVVVKTAEFLERNYPLQLVKVVLPDALQKQLPPLSNLEFLPSTDTGSFDGAKLTDALSSTQANLLVGDFSKNTITCQMVAQALSKTDTPTLITRDTIDLVAGQSADSVLQNPNLSLLASVAQLQKVFRAVYYPKILLLSQPLLQVAEILHKFTLSYPVGLITLLNGQILVAKDGGVVAVSCEESGYSPISLWSGELAAKIVALNLYNPQNFIPASVAAIYHRP